jgi:hypothetical protein
MSVTGERGGNRGPWHTGATESRVRWLGVARSCRLQSQFSSRLRLIPRAPLQRGAHASALAIPRATKDAGRGPERNLIGATGEHLETRCEQAQHLGLDRARLTAAPKLISLTASVSARSISGSRRRVGAGVSAQNSVSIEKEGGGAGNRTELRSTRSRYLPGVPRSLMGASTAESYRGFRRNWAAFAAGQTPPMALPALFTLPTMHRSTAL